MRGLISILFAVSGLFAQTIHMSGNYLDLLDNPIDSASVYYYQDQMVVDSTLTSVSGAFDLQFTIVSVNPSQPSSFQLSQNYPNPFNPSTRIDLSIQEPGSFSIYNIRGALVETLDLPSAGSYELTWGGRNLGAGLYIYVLRSGKQASSRKMILLDGGDGSGLTASQVSYGTSSSLFKPASNDAIHFKKVNTTQLELDFFTPQADTSLGIINGNVGPRQILTIPDTVMYEGDTLQVDWNDYFYNDSETYFPPRFVEFMYLSDTTFYETDVIAIDVLDTNLVAVSNTFSMTWLSVNDSPEFQTIYSDTSIYLDETLALLLDCIDPDDSLLTYSCDLTDSLWIVQNDTIYITPPDTGLYEVEIYASDPGGLSDTTSFSLDVLPWPEWKQITGTIRDIYSLEEMEGLTVRLLDSATILFDVYTPFDPTNMTDLVPDLINVLDEVQTDLDGRFFFPHAPPGYYVLNVVPPDTSQYFAKKGMITHVTPRSSIV